MDLLEAIKYLLLGIIQGITEVIPISSSGHVQLAQTFFNMQVDEGLLFLILVNTGSLVTFLFIYFRKLVELVRDFFVFSYHFLIHHSKPELREGEYNNFLFAVRIIIACIPAGLVGLFLSDYIDAMLITYGTLLVGVGLLLTGTMLYMIKDVRILKGKTMINWTDTILIGLAQAVAVVPGVSRSGMTSSTSIKRGMGIDSALNFSFLLYIPLSIGSLILMVYKVYSKMQGEGLSLLQSLGVPSNDYILYYLLAFVGAIFATYFAYRLIFNIFKSGKLKYFSYYCIIMGLGSIFYYMVA
ncbi:MAG: undecaprenyl-diphosphate phosphatase [Bacilli bacterium]|nr:undecaprenyl-diphosphate phosphatase [Bacilli bacterium]